ncbi:hypothetical protein ABW20_dc0106735 [Dactylellina cionopaga]|nr:hypothetical protein ABW20_dc0106735 [Dactylellina cionopaga]
MRFALISLIQVLGCFPASSRAKPAQLLTPETVTQTFYWFHTNTLELNAPTPTLQGRILSVDQFGFTKYRVTCLPEDSSVGCTYKDFTVTASGESQLYYETDGLKRSVGCQLRGNLVAVCSSRTHGANLTDAATKTWKGNEFPGYYPVVITPEPTAYGRFEFDPYIYEMPGSESNSALALWAVDHRWLMSCVIASCLISTFLF